MHEDTNEIVIRVGGMIGVEIKRSDIYVSHRLSTKQSYSKALRQGKETKKIFAKFVRRAVNVMNFIGRESSSEIGQQKILTWPDISKTVFLLMKVLVQTISNF